MATLKEMMAARLAASKKQEQENSNVILDTSSRVVAEPQAEHAVQQQLAEQLGDSSDRSGVPETAGTVVVGAELQSAVAVVLRSDSAELAQDATTRGELRDGAEGDDPGTDLDVTNPVHFQFLERLQQLQDALLARDPNMKSHLAAIHRTMIEYEELPNLLRPAEIAKIMAAQQAHTNVVLAVATAKKSKAATSKKLSNLSLDDI